MRNGSDYDFWKDADGEYTVPILTEANKLVMRLEQRGIVLSLDGPDIVATPGRLLTDDDREDIRRLKPYVWQAINYVPPQVH